MEMLETLMWSPCSRVAIARGSLYSKLPPVVQAGLEFGKMGAYASLTYVPETFTSASNNRSQVTAEGKPDARVEPLTAISTDLSIRYQLKGQHYAIWRNS